MPKSLKHQVVKLAKESPQMRKHLLPLVTGKKASNESLRLSLTKLAYENPSLRSAILPLVKSAMEHSSPEARKQYLKDHPNADPKNHTVKKQDSDSKSNENGGFKSKADLDKAIDKLDDEIYDMKSDVGYVMEIEDSADDYLGAEKKIQGDFQRYYSRGDITKDKPNIATLIEGFGENSVFKVEKFEEMKQGLNEAIELFKTAEKETGNSAKPYIDNLNKMFNSMADDLTKTLEENPKLNELDDKVMEMQKLEKLKKDWKEPKKEEKSEKKEEKSEKKEKTKAEKLKDYEDAIKNSDMSAEEKEKAIKRSKKPNFDVDGALSGMGDSEEEGGGKKASLKHQLVRLAYTKPHLRKHILPLLK